MYNIRGYSSFKELTDVLNNNRGYSSFNEPTDVHAHSLNKLFLK